VTLQREFEMQCKITKIQKDSKKFKNSMIQKFNKLWIFFEFIESLNLGSIQKTKRLKNATKAQRHQDSPSITSSMI